MQHPADWRLTSPGGIRHKLISQSGSVGEEDASWKMVILIRAADLRAFVLEAFPRPTFAGSILYPRRFYPYGLPALKAVGLDIEGFTPGRPIDPFGADPHASLETYEPYLRVTISFGTGPENEAPDPADPFTFLDVSAQASGQFLTAEVSGDSIDWENYEGDDEKPTEQDTPIEQKVSSTEVEWTCKWSQIGFAWFRDTLIPRMRSMIGKVNSDSMVLFHNAPAETILFDSWSMGYQYTWREGYAGTSPVSLQLKFVEKNFEWTGGPTELESGGSAESESSQSEVFTVQVTHNHLWRPNVGWQRLLINGNSMYEQTNLNDMFAP